MKISLSILDKDNNIKLAKSDFDMVMMTYKGEYQAGDKIIIETDNQESYLKVRLEDSFESCLLYLTQGRMEFHIPFSDDIRVYNSDKAFRGGLHFLWVRAARDYEITQYTNLAYNPYQQDHQEGVYPYVTSNIKAGNIRFAPRNVVDGYFDTSAHGSYPFTSWSNAQKPEAELTINFGRSVAISECIFFLRADFPHDDWFKSMTLKFSQGETEQVELARSGKAQHRTFETKITNTLTLCDLKKGSDASPFTALSQIEVLGNASN